MLSYEGGGDPDPGEGPDPGVHSQEHGAVPLHLRHPVQAQPGGGLRGVFRQEMFHLLRPAGEERDAGEMLPPSGEGLWGDGGGGDQQHRRLQEEEEAEEEVQEKRQV